MNKIQINLGIYFCFFFLYTMTLYQSESLKKERKDGSGTIYASAKWGVDSLDDFISTSKCQILVWLEATRRKLQVLF